MRQDNIKPKKARVLHVLSSLKKNGTETFVMNVFRKIDREKYKFDFLIFNGDKDGYYEEVISYDSKVYSLPTRKQSFLKYHQNLDKFFKEHASDYDVVHLHDMSLSSVAPLQYAKKYGIKTRIMHVHGANCEGLHNKIFHRINRMRLGGLANHALSCSKEASKWGFENTPLYEDSKVIPNGIDLSRFVFDPETRGKIRNQLGIKDDEMAIVHVGNFNIIKNQAFIVDILSELKARGKKAKVLLVGVGGTQENVKEHAKTLGLEKDVFFLGQRDDVGNVMSASDLLIFPSLHEGLGLVVVEGQASGLPVMVSEGVPREVGVTDRFYRLPLEAGAGKWVDEILKIKINGVDRTQPEEIKAYSIDKTIALLSEIYQINSSEILIS